MAQASRLSTNDRPCWTLGCWVFGLGIFRFWVILRERVSIEVSFPVMTPSQKSKRTYKCAVVVKEPSPRLNHIYKTRDWHRLVFENQASFAQPVSIRQPYLDLESAEISLICVVMANYVSSPPRCLKPAHRDLYPVLTDTQRKLHHHDVGPRG